MRVPASWDVFCRVVDNFGDAAVCWRLARMLALEQHADVRLWVDGLATLQRLHPAITSAEHQCVDGVAVEAWREPLAPVEPAEVTLETFGCGLPEAYVESMAARAPRPLWIVLEHLSAEPWVREFHGLPSPHPRWPLDRYFFFPGFVPGTGGLLRERDLFARRDAFSAARRDAFWRAAGHAPVPHDVTAVSLFAYEAAPLVELLEAWACGESPTVAALPAGLATGAVRRVFGLTGSRATSVLRSGALELRIMPFLPQLTYDQLLWSCDVNFVRGEDSFVRAQWAARPFIWHVYPQAQQAHRAKLEAFLELYCGSAARGLAGAISNLMRLWNDVAVPGVTLAEAWRDLVAQRLRLLDHAQRWADSVGGLGDLAENLAFFCRGKLK